MKILLLEPYFIGSHKDWAEELKRFSRHDIEIWSLSGHHWKWRMHGGAVTFARRFNESTLQPDLILATDMLDLTTFLSLTRTRTANIPTAIYFHENQLTYPWSPTDKDTKLQRDTHYAFINFTSALTADQVFFNSAYHRQSFLAALPEFLKGFPDHNETNSIGAVTEKSTVLHLGVDLQALRDLAPKEMTLYKRAVILWNHRWEYDKNPDEFFRALFTLQDRGMEFKLILLGKNYGKKPPIFEEAKERFKDDILHYGYAESKEEYVHWLYHADILPVTSYHDFFGVSVVQAMACDVVPLLPKRLAYPEHLPEAYHTAYFYEDEKHLLKRLQRLIFNARVIRKQNSHQYAMKYDWGSIVETYDTAFEKIKL